jgi:cell wall integrity and stress response component
MAPTSRSLALFAFSIFASLASATPKQTATSVVVTSIAPAPPAATQALSAMTSEGCFSSASGFVDQGTYTWQTSGYCQTVCVALNKPVLALSGGDHCWCGDSLPAANTAVDASECNAPCLGYPTENCKHCVGRSYSNLNTNVSAGGGTGNDTWTVWLTGTNNSVGSSSGIGSSSPAASSLSSGSTSSPPTTSIVFIPSAASLATSAAVVVPVSTAAAAITTVEPEIITVSGSTVVRTMAVTTILATPTSTASSQESPHSSSKAPIAAGVVVGVVALLAIVGGVYFYLHRRRSGRESRGHRRASSLPLPGFDGLPHMNPTLPRLSTMQDSRLEHRLMMEKRQSGVSVFADNEDYSRRILKVANPDSS